MNSSSSKGVQVVVQQGMTYIKRLRRYNQKNAHYQDALNQIAATIQLLEERIAGQEELIALQEEIIRGLKFNQTATTEILKTQYPKVWKVIEEKLIPEG